MRSVVVVDPYSSGNLLAPALRKAGLAPVAVLSSPMPPAVYAASFRPEDFDRVMTYPGAEEDVLHALHRLNPECVIAGTESGVELADQLAARIRPDRANVLTLAAARRHKGAMRQAVAAAGLPGVRHVCTSDPAEVADWLAREDLAGSDLVVKPPKSAGTDGVTRVAAGQDWRPAFTALLNRRNKLGVINDQVIVEEHLVGTEYVVDTFSHDGVHTVVDICRYHKIWSDRQMAVYDSMEWLPYDLPGHDGLLAYTRATLDAIGVRFGAAHSEVMLTPDGPRLIETGARLHGGGQPRFCREATGDSQVDRIVRYCAGQRDIPLDYTLHRHVRVVFLISRATGVVRNVEIFDALRDLPSHHSASVAVRNNDRVQATHDLFSSLALGFVVLAHDSDEQVSADYAAIRRLERDLVVDSG